MQMLGDVLDSVNELTISLHINDISPDMTAELSERIAATKGKINLRVKVIDSREGVSLAFFSRKYKVALTQELVTNSSLPANLSLSTSGQNGAVRAAR